MLNQKPPCNKVCWWITCTNLVFTGMCQSEWLNNFEKFYRKRDALLFYKE